MIQLRAVVVVPARDEEERVGACVAALAAQEGLAPGSWELVVVLDACTDATEAAARVAAGELPLHVVTGPGRGVGFARRAGMAFGAALLRAVDSDRMALWATQGGTNHHTSPLGARGPLVLASTDADTVVERDWLAGILAAVDAGAGAVGGRIALDPDEAAALPAGVLAARERESSRRLAAVRRHTPDAGHHQFSGAALALTLDAHDRLGGLPAVAALEDEALERALRAAGIPIAYPTDVRATTSARTASRVPRGLAQVLRTARWRDAQQTGRVMSTAASPAGGPAGDEDVLVVRGGDGRGGDDLHRALAPLPAKVAIVALLGPGVDATVAEGLARRLRANASLQLVRAAEQTPDVLAELVVRPALNLSAPELAVLASPLTRTWAIRRELLEALSLPCGAAVDLTVLVDVWQRHGLDAIAEEPVEAPGPPARADAPLAAYELLVALATRLGPTPALSSAFADPAGVRRAELGEHPPLVA